MNGHSLLIAVLLWGVPALVWAEKFEVTFEYRPPQKAEVVYLTGDFADWSPSAYRMTYFEAEDIWRKTIELREGRHQYKFVVDGTEWRDDPKNPLRVEDGHGGFNSILELGRVAVQFNENMGDGIVRKEGITFSVDDIKYFNPFRENRVRIIMKTAANDVESVELLIDGAEKKSYELIRFVRGDRFDYFVIYFTTEGVEITFNFLIRDGNSIKYYGEQGLFTEQEKAGRFVSRDIFKDYFKTPEWAKHIVWYQIMIDRWRSGCEENNPDYDILPFTWDWFQYTPKEKELGFYKAVWDRQFGGDLIGVREKLSYLREIGFSAVYFTPIFEATAYHRYNTCDYRHIDDNLYQKSDIDRLEGEILEDPATWQWSPSDKQFFNLIEDAHNRGIRIIVDGVFNHSGTGMEAFKDVQKHGRESRYADWYKIESWEPFEYTGWAGFGGLPEFNQDEYGLVKPVREFIFAITRRWMAPNMPRGIDGWRLDVPMCIKAPFWIDWRKVVKEINPSALIMGEIWTNAERWLRGDKFDCVMNYELAKIIVKYFIDQEMAISTTEFNNKVLELAIRYPQQVTFVQYNLTNSHDTDRLASMVRNPDRIYNTQNRLQNPEGKEYDNSKPTEYDYNIVKLIWTFQFAFPGAPAIWYGDEIGMWGADDPNNRKPMLWEDLMPYGNPDYEINYNLKEFLTRLIAIRNTYPVMRTGEFYPVLADNDRDLVVYKRILGDETVFIVINNSDKPHQVTLISEYDLWDVLNTGDIYKVKRADYIKNGPSHPDGALVFTGDDHIANCISIDENPCHISQDGVVNLTIEPKSGRYFVNRAYRF